MFQSRDRKRIANTFALIGVIALLNACGGGGATVGPAGTPDANPGGSTAGSPGTTTPPVTPPAPPPSPTPPSSSSATVTTAGTSFSPASITVTPGSTVIWQIAGATHNVTFGVNKPAGGDVGDTAPGNSASRTFPVAGTFTYQCTRHSGMTGQVVVQASGTAPTPPTTTPPTTTPPAQGIFVQALANQFTPEEVNIAPGGSVTWEFSQAMGITFKDRAPAGGDISVSAVGSKVSRTFSTAGDYDYYSTLNKDIKGRVRVK